MENVSETNSEAAPTIEDVNKNKKNSDNEIVENKMDKKLLFFFCLVF